MLISYFARKPFGFHFSIEKLFAIIQQNLPPQYDVKNITVPYYSHGLIARICNGVWCMFHQSDINHICGDIHYVTFFLKKHRTINTYHDFTFLKNSSGIKRSILKLFWVTLPVKRSVMVTAISEVTKKELIELTGCNPEKVVVIPNVLASKIPFTSKKFNSTKPTILHIGTTPNKNLPRLIEALKGISCQLHIIGKLNEDITLQLKENNIDCFNEYNVSEEQLIKAYSNSDIVSFCSLNEGFGLPILEAQAVGRVVVTSNLSSMPEVAGNGACFVDPTSVTSIREALVKVINNDDYRENLIHNGIENIKRYDPKIVARRYADLYQSVYCNYRGK